MMMPDAPIDVVIAEDNPLLRNVLAEILRELGYSVRTAPDGLRALVEIRNESPAILISDLNMPRMSGFELLSVVRRRYPKIRVIAMSASYFGGTVPTGIAADAFYEKNASSIARLIQIVDVLKVGPSSRAATPIWIDKHSVDQEPGGGVLLGCPECLRAYPHWIGESGEEHEWECPHCSFQTRLTTASPHMELG
jgi:CheY-like chemotaxis protein